MKESELLDKEEQKRQNARTFINAAREMIDSEGLENISVRKIAQIAGFHNSTIYLYFEDLDQLAMLASMKYFREYSQSLEAQSRLNLSPTQRFLSIWELFADTMLKEPHVFYNFFFGKRSDNLPEIMNRYYDIFPEERDQFSEEIESMYFGKNITDRSLKLLMPMLREDNLVTEETLSMQNELIVCYCKYKLEQKCKDSGLNNQQLREDIMKSIAFIAGIRQK